MALKARKKNSSSQPVSKIIAPSILSADFARLGDEIRAVEKAGADWIHVDVMDGHFVPNLTIGPVVIERIRPVTKLPLDVHLMITAPEKSIASYASAGADIITVHQEACSHLHRVIASIKEFGKKAGVSINPATPLSTLTEILPFVDLVLIMSVNPGFGGQSFIAETLSKVRRLADVRAERGHQFAIEIDGGISPKTAGAASQAGCDAFVAGSAIFGTRDYGAAIRALRGVL